MVQMSVSASFALNPHRQAVGLAPVSRSAVQRFVKASKIIDTSARETTKSGSSDPDSPWAVARLVFSKQLLEQFGLGYLPADHQDVLSSPFYPLYIEAIVFSVEKYLTVRIGEHSDSEHRCFQNLAGEYAFKEDGGVLREKLRKVSLKFIPEARGLFGCATKTSADGIRQGVKLPVYDYTDRTVVSPATFKLHMSDEFNAKFKKGDELTQTGRESVWKGGYKMRYPDTWEAMFLLEFNKTWCNVIELIDHLWQHSKELYKGTPHEHTFRIYHDHLSTMWEKGAILHMQSIGMWERLIRISGPSHGEVSNYYYLGLPGNRPENARCLDLHCFADLMEYIAKHVALTSNYADDDPEKFSRCTPTQCYSAMTCCWSIVPGYRIVQDILDWERVLDVIVNAKRCIVRGEVLRAGCRKPRADNPLILRTSSLKLRDRKASIMADSPMHPDAKRGVDSIIKLGRKAYNLQMGVVEQAENDGEETENQVVAARVDGEEEDKDENSKNTLYRL